MFKDSQAKNLKLEKKTQVPLEILAGVTLIPKYGVHVRIERV